jgi:hypothetical protein
MNDSPEKISPLRRRMIEDMHMRKLCTKTQSSYIRAVRHFAGYLGRSPDMAKDEDLRRYQLHCVDRGISPITLNATITRSGARDRLRSAHLRMPALRRADARHRHLRSSAAHPRTAGLIGFVVTGTSASRNDTLVLHRTVPTQSSIALRREMDPVRPYHKRLRIHRRHIFRLIWTLNPRFTRATVISHANATAQIAIAHRLC